MICMIPWRWDGEEERWQTGLLLQRWVETREQDLEERREK